MNELIEKIRAEFDPKFDALSDRAASLEEERGAAVKAEDAEAIKATNEKLERLSGEVEELTAERDAALVQAEGEATRNRIDKLETALKAITSDERFEIGEVEDGDNPYGPNAEHTFYGDAYKALVEHDQEAVQRWKDAVGEKAMREATGSTGGFLVPDQISDELLRLKVQRTVLRGLFSNVQVNSDTIRIAGQTQGLVAGWVAELAEKPVSELAFGEISTNVFQKAGMAVVSNQLLADANRSVQNLINTDLAKRLALLEELAFIDGTGDGQPRGILRTDGVLTYDPADDGTGLTSTDVADLIDAIITMITTIYTEYQGPPNAIVMHPRTWGRLISARATGDFADLFIIGSAGGGPSSFRTAEQGLPGFGQGPYPSGQLLGLPVYTTPTIPTNKTSTGHATQDESRVIVGNFSEGLILDHSGISLAASEHVYFTSNQTIFRAEDRVGFTAARYPNAFGVIGGAGLANG